METIRATNLDQFAQYLAVSGQSRHTIRHRVEAVARLAQRCDPVAASSLDIIGMLADHDCAQTRSSYRGAYAAWFAYLGVMGVRDDNPMLRVPKIRVPRGEPRPVTDAELVALYRASSGVTRALVLVEAYAGLRGTEANSLGYDDFFTDGPNWRVRIAHAKGGHTQSVPIPEWVVAQVRDSFPTGITEWAAQQRLRRLFRKCGIVGTPHALRHWFATTALRQSYDIRAVQTMMRHASLASTQVYTLVTASEVSAVSDALPHIADLDTAARIPAARVAV